MAVRREGHPSSSRSCAAAPARFRLERMVRATINRAINKLERILIAKACQLLWNALKIFGLLAAPNVCRKKTRRSFNQILQRRRRLGVFSRSMET
jgi:hypothetical protein